MKLGCVYFIKHRNFPPIKIGFTSNETPESRVKCMETFSPYGVELLGVIICENPKAVEKDIHNMYSTQQLSGEWFDIDSEQAMECINYYQSKLDSKDINFKILKVVHKKMFKAERISELKKFAQFEKIYKSGAKTTKTELAKTLGVTRQTLHLWAKKLNTV